MKKIYTQGLNRTSLKQLAIKFGLFLFVITLSIAANSQTNYYLRTDTFTVKAGVKTFVKPDVSSVKSWTTTGDSLGTHPLNFTADNQVFIVQTNGFDGKSFTLTNTKPWRVSGTGSKVVVGTKDSIVTFTSGNAAKLVATVDVVAKSTFIINQIATDSIIFGNLPAGSTVRYGGNTTVSQKVKAANYANLSFAASGVTYYPLTLPKDTIGVSGVFTPRASNIYGSTINFNGTGSQVIPAGLYYNLLISGTKTTSDSLKGAILVAGNFSNQSIGSTLIPFTLNANLTIAGSTINYIALSANQNISNQLFYNLTFSNGQPFNITSIDYANSKVTLSQVNPEIAVGQKVSSSFLTVKTNSLTIDTSASISAITNDTVLTLTKPVMIRLYDYTLGHAANTADTIYATSYSSIDSTVTFSVAPTFKALDTLSGVLFNGKVIVTAVNGNVVKIKAALANTFNLGALSFGQANYQPSPKTLGGFIYLLNTFTAANGTINTLGSTIDYLGRRQNVAAITYDNLRINQDSALAATLVGPSLVTGSFTIEKGKLNTSTKNLLTLDTKATFPTVTNDTFFVNGPLAKNFASTTPFTYQIGAISQGVSHPRTVTITPNTADSKTYTTVFTIGKVQNSTKVDSLTVFSIDTASYYTVTGTNYGGVDSTAKIAFQYRYDTSNLKAGLVLAHYVGTKFKSEGNTLVGTGTLGTITTDNLIGTFGKFAFGFNPKLVPVTFASVGVIATNNGAALISWKSAAEINTNKYVVESSTDGITYTAIGTVKAIGASTYSYTDVTPAAGTNYFRIKAVDNDGKLTYSAVVSLNTNNFTAKVSVYPNPVINKQLNVVLNTTKATYTLTIVNALGQTIVSRSINHNGGTVAYTVALPSTTSVGTYYVKLNDGVAQTTQSVMVK